MKKLCYVVDRIVAGLVILKVMSLEEAKDSGKKVFKMVDPALNSCIRPVVDEWDEVIFLGTDN